MQASTSGFAQLNVETPRPFRVIQQYVAPLQPEERQLRINCAQHVRIERVTVNDTDMPFKYTNALNEFTDRVANAKSYEKNTKWLADVHYSSAIESDPEHARGQLVIQISDQIGLEFIENRRIIKVGIDFWVEQPPVGVQFIYEASKPSHNHVYTYRSNGHASASDWLPCVDTTNELCVWRLQITVDLHCTAVASGELMETQFTSDLCRKTYHYQLGIPTSAINIGFAVGQFEMAICPEMSELTSFCAPGLLSLLEHTIQPLHKMIEFFEELLSCRFPFASYKQVFVDQCAEDVVNYSGLTIASCTLLHAANNIDSVQQTRTQMAYACAMQFFGCFMTQRVWLDMWVVKGLARYVTLLYIEHSFGHNEYLFQTSRVLSSIIDYEQRMGPLVLRVLKGEVRARDALHFDPRSAECCSPAYFDVLTKKAHFVMRMLEKKLGKEALFQVLHKLLAVATTASQQKTELNAWEALLVSTDTFFMTISQVTGHELAEFMELWIYEGGHAHLEVSYTYNRKRNCLEMEFMQVDPDLNARTANQRIGAKGCLVYEGPLQVNVQELDGHFTHTVHLVSHTARNGVHHVDIPCHSKGRRLKKKRVPISTGKELEMDLSMADPESPILWLRVDPEICILRRIDMRQTEVQWQYQLQFERNILAQIQALEMLPRFQSASTKKWLQTALETRDFFYRVRLQAAFSLADVSNKLAASALGPTSMLALFQQEYCSRSVPDELIPKLNQFQSNTSQLQAYFLQLALPQAMAMLRTAGGKPLPAIQNFLLNLLKYNDNSKNRFSDDQYRATIVLSLAQCNQSRMMQAPPSEPSALCEQMTKTVDELVLAMNLDALRPSYQMIVTVNSLKGLMSLQRTGQLPVNISFWMAYLQPNQYFKIRCAAFECLLVLCSQSQLCTLPYESYPNLYSKLIDLCVREPNAATRACMARALSTRLPFNSRTRDENELDSSQQRHALDTAELADTIWMHIARCTQDSRLRCSLIDLYAALYGRQAPATVVTAAVHNAHTYRPTTYSNPTTDRQGYSGVPEKVQRTDAPVSDEQTSKEALLRRL